MAGVPSIMQAMLDVVAPTLIPGPDAQSKRSKRRPAGRCLRGRLGRSREGASGHVDRLLSVHSRRLASATRSWCARKDPAALAAAVEAVRALVTRLQAAAILNLTPSREQDRCLPLLPKPFPSLGTSSIAMPGRLPGGLRPQARSRRSSASPAGGSSPRRSSRANSMSVSSKACASPATTTTRTRANSWS